MKRAAYIIVIPILIMFGLSGYKYTVSDDGTTQVKEDQARTTFAALGAEEKAAFIRHVIETGDCEWNGIKLYGKVQFVTAFPDIKIQYVTAFPDIKVQWVTAFPDQCGKWQEVTAFPDFKVQVVTAFPDIKVQEVTAFPGMN